MNSDTKKRRKRTKLVRRELTVETDNETTPEELYHLLKQHSIKDSPSHNIVKKFIEMPLDFNKTFDNGENYLHVAVSRGLKEMTQLLLKKDKNIDAIDNDGYTALHKAAYYGYVDICKILIENDCDLNIQNKSGNTPIHLAIAKGRKECVTILIENNCRLNIKNLEDMTAMNMIFRYMKSIGIEMLDKKIVPIARVPIKYKKGSWIRTEKNFYLNKKNQIIDQIP